MVGPIVSGLGKVLSAVVVQWVVIVAVRLLVAFTIVIVMKRVNQLPPPHPFPFVVLPV